MKMNLIVSIKILYNLSLKTCFFYTLFQFGSDNLTEESLLIIPKILDEIKSRQLPEVQIIGHTDTVGKQEDNYYLGLKRAEVMEKIVLEAGVPKEIVEINSLGEEDHQQLPSQNLEEY